MYCGPASGFSVRTRVSTRILIFILYGCSFEVTGRLRGMLEGGLRHNIVVYKHSNRDRPD